MSEEKVKTLCMALRSIAFSFISAIEEFMEYPKEKRTAQLLKEAKR